jgi:hypothetical protein
MTEGEGDRTFRPTSGTFLGWVGVALAGGGVVDALLDDRSLEGLRFALGAAIFGLLVWCFMLRPRLVIGARDLQLRNPFLTWYVPLASVRKVAVRAVTRVHTDERRFDGVAVGRPARSLTRARPVRRGSIGLPGLGSSRYAEDADASRVPRGELDADMTADLVVEQILFAADRAREAHPDPRPARRTWAWVELGALALMLVALVVSLLV